VKKFVRTMTIGGNGEPEAGADDVDDDDPHGRRSGSHPVT
jgi:hypothetical protein